MGRLQGSRLASGGHVQSPWIVVDAAAVSVSGDRRSRLHGVRRRVRLCYQMSSPRKRQAAKTRQCARGHVLHDPRRREGKTVRLLLDAEHEATSLRFRCRAKVHTRIFALPIQLAIGTKIPRNSERRVALEQVDTCRSDSGREPFPQPVSHGVNVMNHSIMVRRKIPDSCHAVGQREIQRNSIQEVRKGR